MTTPFYNGCSRPHCYIFSADLFTSSTSWYKIHLANWTFTLGYCDYTISHLDISTTTTCIKYYAFGWFSPNNVFKKKKCFHRYRHFNDGFQKENFPPPPFCCEKWLHFMSRAPNGWNINWVILFSFGESVPTFHFEASFTLMWHPFFKAEIFAMVKNMQKK